MLKVKELMSYDVVSVSERDYITHARQIMRDYDYQLLPVVNSHNSLRGVITDKDVMRITSTRSNITVEGFVSEVPLITPEDDVEVALRAMVELRLRHLPVVKSREEPVLVGIIGMNRIFRALKGRLSGKKVFEVMNTEVPTCQRTEPITRVWSTLLNSGVTGMPVLEGEQPLGMVTIHDIIKSGYVRFDREARHIKTPAKVEKVMNTPLYTISRDETLKNAIEEMLRLKVGRLSVVEGESLLESWISLTLPVR